MVLNVTKIYVKSDENFTNFILRSCEHTEKQIKGYKMLKVALILL